MLEHALYDSFIKSLNLVTELSHAGRAGFIKFHRLFQKLLVMGGGGGLQLCLSVL